MIPNAFANQFNRVPGYPQPVQNPIQWNPGARVGMPAMPSQPVTMPQPVTAPIANPSVQPMPVGQPAMYRPPMGATSPAANALAQSFLRRPQQGMY